MEELKNVTDHYKGRVFSMTSAIGEGQIGHKAKVLQSYNHLCLVEVIKGYISGAFKEHQICRIQFTGDNTEYLVAIPVNYESNINLPTRSVGTKEQTMERYEKMADSMKLKFFETELKASREARESVAKEAADLQKRETFIYIKDRLLSINQELKQLINGSDIKKMSSDKKVTMLVSESATLEKLTLILKMR